MMSRLGWPVDSSVQFDGSGLSRASCRQCTAMYDSDEVGSSSAGGSSNSSVSSMRPRRRGNGALPTLCVAAAAVVATAAAIGQTWTAEFAASGLRRSPCGLAFLTNGLPATTLYRLASSSPSLRRTARAAGKGADAWAADWVEKEVTSRAVVLFLDGDAGATTAAAKATLSEASVRYDPVDVGMLGGSYGTAIVASIRARAGIGEDVQEPVLPLLFVGGVAVGGIGCTDLAELASSGQLRSTCEEAGAEIVESNEGTNMTWTVRDDGRWLPPKTINGRRWYQDEANSATPGDDAQADKARFEFNRHHVSNGAGRRGHSGVSASGLQLMRQDTNLDMRDENGDIKRYGPFSETELIMSPDTGLLNPRKGSNLKEYHRWRLMSLEEAQKESEREGLDREEMMWLNSQERKWLVQELKRRQCRYNVFSGIDVETLREALKEEMLKERVYSPTKLGVVPGVIQDLSLSELRREREADTDVPLLIVVISARNGRGNGASKGTPIWNPSCYGLRQPLQVAANNILRAARIVQVIIEEFPSVAKEYQVSRYPTLIWMAPRNGPELGRLLGVQTAMAIVETTRKLTQKGEITDGRAAEILGELPEPVAYSS